LLEAAERRSRIEDVVTIHPHCPGAHLIGDVMRLLDVAGPNGGGKAVQSPIRAVDHFVDALKRDDAHHRTKDLFLRDFHVVLNIGEHGGLDEVAAIADAIAAADQFRALVTARANVAHDLVELRLVYLRALFRSWIERIADGAFLRSDAAFFDELIVDLLFDKHPRSSAAALAVIEEQSEVGAFDSFIQVCVSENNIRTLPAEFQRYALQIRF
jgi:limonene-1,2-epoxide hydrolase